MLVKYQEFKIQLQSVSDSSSIMLSSSTWSFSFPESLQLTSSLLHDLSTTSCVTMLPLENYISRDALHGCGKPMSILLYILVCCLFLGSLRRMLQLLFLHQYIHWFTTLTSIRPIESCWKVTNTFMFVAQFRQHNCVPLIFSRGLFSSPYECMCCVTH